MRPHTLLVVGPLPPPVHGASRITQAVADEARARTSDTATRVEVVSTSGDPTSVSVRYHLSRMLAHGRAVWHLVASRRHGRTVLYLGGAGGAGLWYQFGLAVVSRALRVDVVFHHHSYGYLMTAHRAMRWIVRAMGRRGTHVCLSPSMARAFRAVYRPAGGVLTVSNARFVRDDAAVRGAGVGRLRLIHVSNLCVEKGTVRVVNAFRRLRARGIDTSLVLVGEAADRDVRAAVERARRDHPDTFHHHGRASEDEVFRALDGADLFVFPTAYRYEAQPLVVLEALARGVPVLASERGALGDLLPGRWLVDEAVPLDEQIVRFVPQERPRLAACARDAFDRSRGGDDDLMRILIV